MGSQASTTFAVNMTKSTVKLNLTTTEHSLSKIIFFTTVGVIALISIICILVFFCYVYIDEDKTRKSQSTIFTKRHIYSPKRRKSIKMNSLKTNKRKVHLEERVKKRQSKCKFNMPSPTSKSASSSSNVRFSDIFDSNVNKKHKVGTSSKSWSFGKWSSPNKGLFKSNIKEKTKLKTTGIVWATPNV